MVKLIQLWGWICLGSCCAASLWLIIWPHSAGQHADASFCFTRKDAIRRHGRCPDSESHSCGQGFWIAISSKCRIKLNWNLTMISYMSLESDQIELNGGQDTLQLIWVINRNLASSELYCWATGCRDVMRDWFIVLKINALLPNVNMCHFNQYKSILIWICENRRRPAQMWAKAKKMKIIEKQEGKFNQYE